MANNFSGDSNCKALWNFENGALTTDSKGGNTLSVGSSTPTVDTVNFKQGAASCDFESSNNEWWTATDSNLDAGFPLKNGDAVGTISVCCWFKLESTGNYQTIYEKGENGKYSFMMGINNANKVRIFIGKSSGTDIDVLTYGTAVASGIWYHVGATFDNSDKTYRIRVWDDNAGAILGSELTGTNANNVNIEDGPLRIGDNSWGNSNLDGLIDELVVFDDVLLFGEIDEIRAGTYVSANILSLAGLVEGTSGITGAIGANPVSVLGLAGLSEGTSGVTGAIGANPVSVLELAGTSAGTSAITGAIEANPVSVLGLTGIAAGTSSITGAIGTNPVSVLGLAGISAGVSLITGALTKISTTWQPPSLTQWLTGYGYYRLLVIDGDWGDPPPDGTVDVDYEIVSLLPSALLTIKKLTCAANSKFWFEDI